MAKRNWSSGSDPAARIFNIALHGCYNQTSNRSDHVQINNGLKQIDLQQKSALALSGCKKEAASKNDQVQTNNGFSHEDSQQEPISGLNSSVSPWQNTGKFSEMSRVVEIHAFEDCSQSQSPDVGKSNHQLECTKEENLVISLSRSHSNISSSGEHGAPNINQGKKKVKSVISIIHDHLSCDSDSGSSRPSLKRSTELLNSSFDHEQSNRRRASDKFMSERSSDTALLRREPREMSKANDSFDQEQSNDRSASDTFMSERRSDTALLLCLEPREMSEAHHSTPKYTPRNSDQNSSLKSRSFESYTPNSRFSEKRTNARHHRSSTCPSSKRSAADVTPYSPSARSSELSPMRRIKRMRTSCHIPSYSIKSLSFKCPVRIVDSHCHLDFLFTREDFHDSYSYYRRKYSETYPDCYEGCITIFCEPQNFSRKPHWDPILQEQGVWAAFGCHPHMANNYNDETEDALIEAMKDPKVIAFGEMGLDYSKRNNCDRDLQQSVLRRQLKLALSYQKPLVIHCREAHEDCMEIMKELVPRNHFIHLHCFTDTWERAEQWLKEFPNLYIGITNLVTFPTAEEVHDIARKVPIERLLLETDTPYFVPKSLTMRWSHPGMVIHAAAQIAAFRMEVSLEHLLRTVRNNTYQVYKI